MINFKTASRYLRFCSQRHQEIHSWQDWLEFRREKHTSTAAWVYLISFSENPEIYAWGTASGDGQRIRSMGLFHTEMQGKYDRRVDYLMLKRAFGPPNFFLFEFANQELAKTTESRLAKKNGQKACFGGVRGDRREILFRILEIFQGSQAWPELNSKNQQLFCEFVREVLPQSTRRMGDRTWHYGDVLEPGALERFGLEKYRSVLAECLQIRIGQRETSPLLTVSHPPETNEKPGPNVYFERVEQVIKPGKLEELGVNRKSSYLVAIEPESRAWSQLLRARTLFLEGHDKDEIAEIMHLSTGRVNELLHGYNTVTKRKAS